MALWTLTQIPGYQFHFSNMLHATEETEDEDLDSLLSIAICKVMSILADKMLSHCCWKSHGSVWTAERFENI